MRRILVLRGGALGDFIVTLPALNLLRQRWPAARIELIGNATAAQLAVSAGLLDAAHSQHEARWNALYSVEPLPREIDEWLATFDLVINFWPDQDGELRRHFSSRPGQRFLTAGALPTQRPAAAHYCGPLRELGIVTSQYHYRLPASDRAEPHSGLRIAIHPGSGSPRKNWPLARWAEICGWLKREHAAELLIVSGEAEPDGMLAEFGGMARNLALPELAGQLTSCRLFLGHDSGISHLAAAVGTPCLLLFGPTDPAMWAPPTPQVRVLRKGDDPSAISVADVIAETESVLQSIERTFTGAVPPHP